MQHKYLQDYILSDREDRKAREREKAYNMAFKKSKELYRKSDAQKDCGEKSKEADLYWRVYNRKTQVCKGLAFKKCL